MLFFALVLLEIQMQVFSMFVNENQRIAIDHLETTIYRSIHILEQL